MEMLKFNSSDGHHLNDTQNVTDEKMLVVLENRMYNFNINTSNCV